MMLPTPRSSFRPLLPSDSGFQRQSVEIACIRSIHERGFGFAQPLTGTSGQDIFLNESRIASLRVDRNLLEGVVIAVQTVERPDGKRSGLKARVVNLTDADLAPQLWQQVAHNRRMEFQPLLITASLVPGQPVLLPLTLALLDTGLTHGVVLELLSQLPAQAWTVAGIDLCLPLEHAEPKVKAEVVRHFVQFNPVLAFRYLQLPQIGPSTILTTADFESLWTANAQHGSAFADWLVSYGRQAPTAELITWAVIQVDRNGSRAELGWKIIVVVMARPGAVWPHEWDSWTGLLTAPKEVATALARVRYTKWAAAISNLRGFSSSSVKMLTFDTDEILDSLDARDLQLAAQWCPTPTDEASIIEERQRAQMITARAAEKCALRYFEGLDQLIRDVAITQLNGDSEAWTVMDLELNGVHGIDVKNCRRTPNGGMRSGRWKVKSLKSDAAGNPVTLLGVSSPYTAFGTDKVRPQANSGNIGNAHRMPPGMDGNSMIVLGVTNASEIRKLMTRFKDIADIYMPEPRRLAEMPAWCWDYPGLHYRRRDEAMAEVRQELERHDEPLMRRLLDCSAPALLVLLGMEVPISTKAVLDEQQQNFLETLSTFWRADQVKRRGSISVPRLPWLYLFTLHTWLHWRLSGRPSNASCFSQLFDPADDSGSQLSPDTVYSFVSSTGIIDPACTLNALVAALALLDTNVPSAKFGGMTRFTLQPNGIFRSTFSDGQSRTLIAHCGGKLPNMVDCGHWPLVYGKHETCACGRLICKKCHSCTTDAIPCDHERERKSQAHKDEVESDLRQTDYAKRRYVRPFRF